MVTRQRQRNTFELRTLQDRISELKEYIIYQEKILSDGANKIAELNTQYLIADREYKELLSKKNKLLEEVITLTQNLELYSNL